MIAEPEWCDPASVSRPSPLKWRFKEVNAAEVRLAEIRPVEARQGEVRPSGPVSFWLRFRDQNGCGQ